MNILIVDDDEDILRLYDEELKEEGYEVVTCNSGEDELEAFKTENPDIVTLDILMPDIDGITLLRRMKEINPKISIIMSTAYDYKDNFSVWASDAYMVKSSDLGELKSTIRNIVAGK